MCHLNWLNDIQTIYRVLRLFVYTLVNGCLQNAACVGDAVGIISSSGYDNSSGVRWVRLSMVDVMGLVHDDCPDWKVGRLLSG